MASGHPLSFAEAKKYEDATALLPGLSLKLAFVIALLIPVSRRLVR